MRQSTAVVLAFAAVALTATGCGSSAAAAPATLTVTGDMTVNSGLGMPGKPCTAEYASGLDDIHSGTPVVFRDSAGKTIALSSLNAGAFATESGGVKQSVDCTFPFTFTKVPSGDQFYSVEVANRGQVNVSVKDIAAPIHLNLKGG